MPDAGLPKTKTKVDYRVQIVTIVLVLYSGCLVDLAFLLPGQSIWPAPIIWVTLGVLTLGVNWWISHKKTSHVRAVVGVFLTVLVILPFVPLRNQLSGSGGIPMEMNVLLAFRNLGLALAAFSMSPTFLRLSGLVSLFLTLFSVSLPNSSAMGTWLGIYAGLATLWLMVVYWDAWIGNKPNALPTHGSLGFPAVALVLMLLVVGSVVGGMLAAPKDISAFWLQVSPFSGGTERFDPNAWAGVGDGDEQVAGDNPETVGNVKSDIMLKDDGPSLYDVVSDMYGEPFKVKKIRQAIPLGWIKSRELDRKPAENFKANRRFPTSRNIPQRDRRPDSVETDALFFVSGKTPQYLRISAYDRFDGRTLIEEPVLSLPVDQTGSMKADNWFVIALMKHLPWVNGQVKHDIKLAHLGKQLSVRELPTPPHLEAFRLGRVNRPDFFNWSQIDVLALTYRKVPPGEQLELVSGILDRRKLSGDDFNTAEDMQSVASPLPQTVHNKWESLAEKWVEGLPRGREQVEAIENKLRTEYTLDPMVKIPQGEDTISPFLFESRRGPDYMFAVSAAVLLRSLGYYTRVTSGFYVDPEKFDYTTQHTPVRQEDAHFWVEVRLRTGAWMVVEPSPGYEIPRPARTLWESLCSAVAAVANWLAENWLVVGSLLNVTVLGVLFRRRIYDVIATWVWHLRSKADTRGHIVSTLSLLDARCRWAGVPRPTGTTFTKWYKKVVLENTDPIKLSCELPRLANWALYSPVESSSEPDKVKSLSVCRQAVKTWTMRRLREALLGQISPDTQPEVFGR
ncbi:MAG: transglutaminase-like domain-containing protein [Gemmataceae bacterium]